ncbi:MAG: hypothetical protein ACP5RP_03255 [Candidatus Micrarchaeia archaeon]
MDDNNETMYESLEKYGNLMVKAESYLLETEMKRGLGSISSIIPESLADKIEPYFIACGVLDIAGLDMTKNNIKNLFVAADSKPNELILDGISILHYRNHLVYILAIVLLDSLGKEVTQESLLSVIESMEIQPDISMAKYAVSVYNKLAPDQGLNKIPEI